MTTKPNVLQIDPQEVTSPTFQKRYRGQSLKSEVAPTAAERAARETKTDPSAMEAS